MWEPTSVIANRKRRLVRRVLIAVPIVASLWVTAVTFRVVAPIQGNDRRADVIVSLAPYLDRLPLAFRLFRAHQGGALAVSWTGTSGGMQSAAKEDLERRLCRDADDPLIHCFVPSESSTLGEALTVKRLAAENGWKSITVVTSRYHAFRTKLIFDRCMGPDIDVEVIHSETRMGPQGWFYHIAYENAAYIKALFETARC